MIIIHVTFLDLQPFDREGAQNAAQERKKKDIRIYIVVYI